MKLLLNIVLGLITFFSSSLAVLCQPVSLPSFGEAEEVGVLSDVSIDEASGIAPSRLDDDVLWIINDGGNSPRLFAVDVGGKALASFYVPGADNEDWEDLASFVHQGRSYLLIADVGDNDAERVDCDLYFVEEPVLGYPANPSKRVAGAARRLTFVYEDGPRDCESAAVDISNNRVLLLSKREKIPILYSLPLDPDHGYSTLTAKRLGEAPHIPPPRPEDILNDPIYGAYSSQVTGMDIDSQGRYAVILTYKNAYWHQRKNSETWEEVFSRKPELINIPVMRQAEAICFSRDAKSLYVTSEKIPSPLYRIPIEFRRLSESSISKE